MQFKIESTKAEFTIRTSHISHPDRIVARCGGQQKTAHYNYSMSGWENHLVVARAVVSSLGMDPSLLVLISY